MGNWIFADYMQTPSRKGFIRGTVRRVTFPSGGGIARETLAMDITEAIRFFDVFQSQGGRA